MKIKEYISIGLISLMSLIGCENGNKIKHPDFVLKQNIPELNGYDATLEGIELRVGRYNKKETFGESGFDSEVGVIYCLDFEKDGRVDKIALYFPKGSPLEKLASAELLSKIEQKLMETK